MIYRRRISRRLRGYDYSRPGRYFVTAVCKHRERRLGEVVEGEMRLNDAGKMVAGEWFALESRFPQIRLHASMVMPNHFHAILEITEKNGRETPRKKLGDIMRAFLSITTVQYIKGVKEKDWPPFDKRLWQKGYWDIIIWKQEAFHRISRYILHNPAAWERDLFRRKRVALRLKRQA